MPLFDSQSSSSPGANSSKVALAWLAIVMILTIIFAGQIKSRIETVYSAGSSLSLKFVLLPNRLSTPMLDEAKMALSEGGVARAMVIPTRLSEEYFVFGGIAEKEGVLFLPSRHVVDLSCWLLASDGSVVSGSGGYSGVSGQMRSLAQGFAIRVRDAGTHFICAQKSTGAARIYARSMTEDEEEELTAAFAYSKGGLEAWVLVLLGFMILAGIVNKDWRFGIFAASLFLSMRVAQMSQGSDRELFGFLLHLDAMPRIRMISLALHIFLQLSIFKLLTRQDTEKMPRIGLRVWSRATFMLSVALMALACMLPFKWYLPIMWVVAANAMANLIFRLVFLLKNNETRSDTIAWCAMGFGLTFLAWGAEMASAAFGLSALVRWINNDTAAAASALMILMAFSQQLKRERQEKLAAQSQLRKAYDTSPVGLFEALPNSSGTISQGNPAFSAILGAAMDLVSFFEEGAWDGLLAQVSPESEVANVTIKSRDGMRWFDVHLKLNQQGLIDGAILDITEKVQRKLRLEFLANHDPLTEFLNLRGLENALDSSVAAPEIAALVAYFDLDRFKLINDLYGHEAGDAVLREVASRLSIALGEEAVIGRIGGDEFLAIFRDDDMDRAQHLCRKAIDSIALNFFKHGEKSFKISCSAGLVEASAGGGKNASAMIGAADSACRQAKKQGPARLVAYGRRTNFFETRMQNREIATMFDNDALPPGLCLVGQPIMSLEAPFESLNFEMLLRMRQADGSMVGAFPLIETAEVHGHTAKLDFWVLSTALNWIRDNRPALASTKFICVNISGGSLNDEAFLEKAFSFLEEHAEEMPILCIEITESVALLDLENVKRFASRVLALGASIALDDFGAGYCSFGYLKDLPASALKVDGSLVKDAMVNPATKSILVALGGLAEALGMRSVGEWAENAAAVQMLAEVGFGYAQGYAIAKPLPLNELLKVRSCAELISDGPTLDYVKALQQTRRKASGG